MGTLEQRSFSDHNEQLKMVEDRSLAHVWFGQNVSLSVASNYS
jgi:hypothetical protein